MAEADRPRTYIIGQMSGYEGEIPVLTSENFTPGRNTLVGEIQTGDAELSLEADGITDDEAPVEDSKIQ